MKAPTRLDLLAARFRLRGVTRLGRGARTTGAPYVRNQGRIEIGDDFFLASDPAASHIVVAVGARLAIGRGVHIGSGAAIACASEIRIGDDVYIGRDVMILDSDYHQVGAMRSPGAPVPIVIADGARIDDGAIVLKGARIGAGASIGASSVVSRAVPPGAFAFGVPARVR
jgi:acetyltransferase-like isoleucine patch superfamily enzyme